MGAGDRQGGYKFHNIYRGKGPVLTAVSVEPAEKPWKRS